MRGLDPRIHLEESCETMDCRVKPGNDELVVPANAGTHMWTAPVPQEFFGSDRIACIHMSGLLMRSQWIAGQDGFRDASSKQPRDLPSANGSHGLSRTSDRSILPSAPLLQLRLNRGGESADRPIS